LATEHGWRITAVIDTHIHADHLSRARALAGLTGARLYLPDQQRAHYPLHPIRDGEAITVGSSALTVLQTPGHTFDSACYLLDGRALFTGDTLFLAAVGRPDLEAAADEARERARLLYRSLRRLGDLPSDILVLPGHTSAPVPFDETPLVAPLGEVVGRIALLREEEDGFVNAILARIPPTPPNHQQIVALNEAGSAPDGDVTELEAGANRCAVA
jgi:glyoxylase-like metal-dependent hydrolase (beta-lactamase superfamily II)